MSQGNTFYGLDNRRSVKVPHIIIPYTLNLRIDNSHDKEESENYAEFLQRLPNEFPYIVVTKPKIDYDNKIISLIAGSIISDMDKRKVNERILRYIQSYGPMVGKVSYNFELDSFRDIFMPYMCDYCRELSRNRSQNICELPIDIIHQERDRGGLGIRGWEEPYIRKKLLPAIANEGLVNISGDKFRLTEIAVSYCEQIKHPAR